MALHLIPLNQEFNIKYSNASFMATLDGNRCKSEKLLMQELALVFKFPDYFGHNFDALYDCLTDLEWLGVDHIYLLITYPSLICSLENEYKAKELFDAVLKDVLEAYQTNPIHFHVIAEKSFLKLINPSEIV